MLSNFLYKQINILDGIKRRKISEVHNTRTLIKDIYGSETIVFSHRLRANWIASQSPNY